MKIYTRYNIFPGTWYDRFPFMFICTMIAMTYWFELFVVAPGLFELSSVSFIFLFIFGHFILINVVGNFMGVLMCDTSIKGRILPTEMKPGVKFCSVCETVTPPRSYHCDVCKTCILKRDHHCTFAGYCIGHYNHRYFVLFMSYMMLGMLVALPFNIFYLWDYFKTSDIYIIPKVIFPLLALMIWSEFTVPQFYLIIFVINIGGLVFIAAWSYFHWKLILKGTLVYENKRGVNIYDLGYKKNIIEVLGERWYLTWLSPFVESKLPNDGITFNVNDSSSLNNHSHKHE